MGEMKKLRCVIMRGGTSKAVMIMENELPKDPQLRDKVILAIYGSPDVRQIDGLGGADILTSKVAIIGPPSRDDADVDYTFGQVGIDRPIVDYSGNCGNISAAVGPFAIDEGLVRASEPIARVKIHLTNTRQVLIAHVPVKNGKAAVEGDYKIDGAPGTGARIDLDFSAFAGSATGKLLPTGNVEDVLDVAEFGELKCSIVDAANPTVFVLAKDIGMRGTENPLEIQSNKDLMDKIEAIRGTVAELLGFVNDRRKAAAESPYRPFFIYVGEPADYTNYATQEIVKAESANLVCRHIGMRKAHKAYAVTGTVCTGAAAMIDGTVVNKVTSEIAKRSNFLRIGHPSGIVTGEFVVRKKGGELLLERALIGRTARRILEGYVYVRRSVYHNL